MARETGPRTDPGAEVFQHPGRKPVQDVGGDQRGDARGPAERRDLGERADRRVGDGGGGAGQVLVVVDGQQGVPERGRVRAAADRGEPVVHLVPGLGDQADGFLQAEAGADQAARNGSLVSACQPRAGGDLALSAAGITACLGLEDTVRLITQAEAANSAGRRPGPQARQASRPASAWVIVGGRCPLGQAEQRRPHACALLRARSPPARGRLVPDQQASCGEGGLDG